MINVEAVADKADMIVDGYAFTKAGNAVRVLNLNDTDKAAVLSLNGEMLETTMNDIELKLVMIYYNRNKQFLEE